MRALLVAPVLALAVAGVVTPPAHASGPALETPEATLRAALDCPETLDDPDHEPLLLVHGTFTNAAENWGFNWLPVYRAEGWDVCTVTLPNRSLGDMQVQAEYVVFAVREMAARSGEKVDVMGHSQGAVHPRWAVKWWPDVQASVDDLVLLAGPQHGTAAAGDSPFGCFPSCWQMQSGSNYLNALNAGDETPGAISYTSIYTLTDELVQPQFPESTSALEGGTNVLIQDVCPGRPAEHAFLMSDHAVHAVAIDALTNPGPADTTRLDPLDACAGIFFDGVDPVSHGPEILERSMAQGLGEFENVDEEPPLKPYAQGAGSGTSAPAGDDAGTGTEVAGARVSEAARSGEVTPATGGLPPLVAAAALTAPAVAVYLRRRRAR